MPACLEIAERCGLPTLWQRSMQIPCSCLVTFRRKLRCDRGVFCTGLDVAPRVRYVRQPNCNHFLGWRDGRTMLRSRMLRGSGLQTGLSESIRTPGAASTRMAAAHQRLWYRRFMLCVATVIAPELTMLLSGVTEHPGLNRNRGACLLNRAIKIIGAAMRTPLGILICGSEIPPWQRDIARRGKLFSRHE